MRHDKRSEDGMFRARTSAESRHNEARRQTQTCEGPSVHSRTPRRQGLALVQFSATLFKNGKVNRDGYHPAVPKKGY